MSGSAQRQTSRWGRIPGLSTLILLGLLLGIACGLFFGEYCRPLEHLGMSGIALTPTRL